MLVLTRRAGEAIYILLSDDLDPATPIGEVFKDVPIVIKSYGVRGEQMRMGIDAARVLDIARDDVRRRPGGPAD